MPAIKPTGRPGLTPEMAETATKTLPAPLQKRSPGHFICPPYDREALDNATICLSVRLSVSPMHAGELYQPSHT